MSLFETATRKKFRFASAKGDLTCEQLWDLPLKAENGLDLDSIAHSIYRDLKEASEGSFVEDAKDPNQPVLEMKLNLVRRIIEIKKEERQNAEQKAKNAAERKRLLEILAKRQDEELEGLSKEEIEQRIQDLS